MVAIGVLSNSDVGMQYHVSGLTEDTTLRFTITDAHTAPAEAYPSPPGTQSTPTDTGSGSYQVTYKVPAGITEKTFDIVSSVHMELINGRSYHVVLSTINYVPFYADNTDSDITTGRSVMTYLSPPADNYYTSVVGHGNKKFTLRAGPGAYTAESGTWSGLDTYTVSSYLVTIYKVSANGVAQGDVWQNVYAAPAGVLALQTIDCTASGTDVDGTEITPAMTGGLLNDTAYELIVAARNATGTVATAETFHISPRETPNAVTVAVAAASGAQPIALSAIGKSSPPNAGTTDNKVEFSITLGETAGPVNNEHDFAVIVKLTGGDNAAGGLYKRINLDNYTSGTNDNSTLNGKDAATGGFSPTVLQNYLVANGQPGWWTNADGATGTNIPVSILDGTVYTFSAKAINIMTTTADAAGSDDSNTAVVTPSGLPIKPKFAEISTLVGHAPNKIRIKLVNTPNSGPEDDNGHNGASLSAYGIVVGTTDSVPVAVNSFGWNTAGNYAYVDITGDGAGNPFVNGTPYSLTLTANNANGFTEADEITDVRPRTVPSAVDRSVAGPAQGAPSLLGSGELSGSVTAFTNMNQTGGTDAADITYQYQVSTDNFATYPVNVGSVIHDISGVGSTSKIFTGLTNGTQYKMRARAVTNVWDNSIIGTGVATDEFTTAQGSAGATTEKAVGGEWAYYDGTYTPSVAPTIAVSSGTTLGDIVDKIVNRSHINLGVNLGDLNTVAGDGKRVGPYLTTDDGARSNDDYAITGIKVTATAIAGGDTGETTISAAGLNNNWIVTGVTTPANGVTGHGQLNYHNYNLSFEAINAVYPADASRAITTTSPVHVTNTVLAIPAVTGTVDVGQKQITYEWSVPNWTTLATAQYPIGTSFDWVRTECAPTLNANGAADGAITYPQSNGEYLYIQSDNGSFDMVVGQTAYTSVQSGLRDGTKYKFKVTANAKAYHTEVTPIGYNPSFVDIDGKQPYSKPSISVDGGEIQISSNGDSLNETIMISAVNTQLAIQDISTAINDSTQPLNANGYYAAGNPPFTSFYNGSDYQDLVSTATVGTTDNYLVLSENDAGATIKLEGELTTWA